MDDDDTLDSLSTFLDRYAQARETGRLSMEDVQSAYIEYTGLDIAREEIYRELSHRFLCLIDETSGELRYLAVLDL